MLLISVIVPVFNHERYIVECLDSVRDSDYKHVELIIIDDGSTDRSSEVVSAWLAENGRFFVRTVFQRQVNAGICKTLNRQIALSHGDIIVPLASDDVLLSAGISLRVAFLQAHPHLLAVFGDAAMIDCNSTIICRELEKNLYKGNKKALADPRFIAAELILKWSVPGPVFAAWRRAYDPVLGVGLYDESLLAEDRNMYLRLLSRQALGYIPDEVALYRHTQQSLCHVPERNLAVRHSIYKCEQEACRIFTGKEKFFLELVSRRSLADKLFLSGKGSFARYLLAKLMKVAVEVTYRIHKLMYLGVSMLAPSPAHQDVIKPSA